MSKTAVKEQAEKVAEETGKPVEEVIETHEEALEALTGKKSTLPDMTPEQRVAAARKDIEAACDRWKCSLRAQLGEPEPVGNYGSKIQITAQCVVFPE